MCLTEGVSKEESTGERIERMEEKLESALAGQSTAMLATLERSLEKLQKGVAAVMKRQHELEELIDEFRQR